MTDPDWLALADFLDAHANDMRAWTEDETKFRAAAVGLRQLADENRALREGIDRVVRQTMQVARGQHQGRNPQADHRRWRATSERQAPLREGAQ